MGQSTLLRARTVHPISRPAIEDGAVFIRNGLVVELGKWRDLAARWGEVAVEDLGEVILLPGLVNAHCHLDYTGMAGLISPPKKGEFADWIKAILALKAHWSYTEYAASWMKGAHQLMQSGSTMVADIEAVPELLPESWESTPLRVISFIEMTGVRSRHEPERIFAEAEAHVARLPESDKHYASISPHALYSTPPRLLEKCAVKMLAENALITMHLAESRAEFDMFMNASGPLYDWLKSQREMDDCGGCSPVKRAFELGALKPNFLAVHVNYLADGDADLLARNGCSVAHCPRSHDYFQHDPFPYETLKKAGVNICLGTDSLASSRMENGKAPTLNIWDEMRVFSRAFPNVRAQEILEMATLNGAKALRMPTGAAFADFVATPARTLDEAVFENAGRVRTFINGREVTTSG